MAGIEQGLTDVDLPGLFEAADAASLEGQRRYVTAIRLSLILAVVAAITGVVSWTVGTRGMDLAAFGTAVALIGITGTELYVSTVRPADQWYDGRAFAESAKSLAWRYSVGGIPFAKEGDEDEVQRRFGAQMAQLLVDVPETSVKPSERPVVTERMAALRASDLPTRKAAYLESRIKDQQRWYAAKAKQNGKLAGRWRVALLVIEGVGIVAALVKAFGVVRLDLAGIVAAVIAAGTAWASLRQFSTLARAYTFAAHELAIARIRLDLVHNEDIWAAEVADSEEAVSREHTMWRASRSRTSL